MDVEEIIKKAEELYYDNDLEQAYELYLEAASCGHPKAFERLGDMYFFGMYVRQDHKKSMAYYDILAQKGNLSAMSEVVDLMAMTEDDSGVCDPEKYMRYLNALSDSGNGIYKISLGLEYVRGLYVERDIEKAIELFETAVKLGKTFGYSCIADLYFDGEHVPQDYKKAKQYYEKDGPEELTPLYRLAIIYDEGLETEKNPKKALELYKAFRQEYEDRIELMKDIDVECDEDKYYPIVLKRIKELQLEV